MADDDIVEALQTLPEWRVVGDSLDGELAVYAYDVPADIVVEGVIVPAGRYTREITVDGRHVIAHRWNDRAVREKLLDDVDKQHERFEPIVTPPTGSSPSTGARSTPAPPRRSR